MTQVSKNPVRAEQQPAPVVLAPLVDIFENDEEFLIVADLPGVQVEGLRVHLDHQRLEVEGTQSDRHADREPHAYRRTFQVPDVVDRAAVRAELSGGVLHLHLGKGEASRPREIDVSVG